MHRYRHAAHRRLPRADRSAADAGYSAAREGAGVVDVSGALRRLDVDTLTPGVNQLVNPRQRHRQR